MEDRPSQHDVYSHPSAVEHWRHLVEIAALLIAAAWAFYVFVYQERIKPENERPILDVSTDVERQALPGNKELVSVRLTQKNIGPVDLQLDMFALDVYGVRYADRAALQSRTFGAASVTTWSLPERSRTLLATQYIRLRPFGGAVVSGLAPGREKHPGFDFAVPAKTYDSVFVQYAFCYQRTDDRRKTDFRPVRKRDGSYDLQNVLKSGSLEESPFCGAGYSRAVAL